MAKRPLTVIGFLGTNRDRAARGPARWKSWRPTVALGQHAELSVARLVLLHGPDHLALAEQVAADVRQVSPPTVVDLQPIAIADPWDLEQVSRALLDFAGGFPFDPATQDYLVHITTGTHIAQLALFLLVESRHIPARLLQSVPPRSETGGGSGSFRITDLDLSRFDSIARRFRAAREEKVRFLKAGISTRNSDYNCLVERIERVALLSRDPILLCGPTGAGKTELANRIYELKKQRGQIQGALCMVNCAALRGDRGMSMSTLFGHARDAFTGASKERQGQLRQADGGLLFLDEIGDLGLEEQGILLHALEHKTFHPLGSDRAVRSDFQLIAATNRDLGADVRGERFREDLLARIKLWTFRLPGLRERPEDIEPNLDIELGRAGQAMELRVTLNREARDLYVAFACSPAARWRASFRDLRDSVRRMALFSQGGRIGVAQVQEEVARLGQEWAGLDGPSAHSGVDAASSDPVVEVLGPTRAAAIDPFDRVQLAEVVTVCRTARSLSDAGRVLFAASRAKRKRVNDADRLRKYLARFRLSFETLRSGPVPRPVRRAARA